MPLKPSSDYVKSQKPLIKNAMKGRPMYFGVQSAGMEGLFRVSKKPGECQKNKLADGKPFDESGKDKDEAKKANTDGVDGKAATGVCQGANGTLKLFVLKGGLTEGQCKFIKNFVSKQMKLKSVKKVEITEVEEGQLPVVPDKDPLDGAQPTAAGVQKRVTDLLNRSKAAGGDALGFPNRINPALEIAKQDPGNADDSLDDAESAIALLETAKSLNNPNVLNAVQGKLRAWDLDGAEAALESAGSTAPEARGAASATPEARAAADAGAAAGRAAGADAGRSAPELARARLAWEKAVKDVDAQVGALQKELQAHDDEEVQEIAKFGLDGVDSDAAEFKRKLEAAVHEMEHAADAAARRRAATDVQKCIKDLASHLNSDERVAVIDDNPFSVKVSVKKTLGTALAELDKAIKAATK